MDTNDQLIELYELNQDMVAAIDHFNMCYERFELAHILEASLSVEPELKVNELQQVKQMVDNFQPGVTEELFTNLTKLNSTLYVDEVGLESFVVTANKWLNRTLAWVLRFINKLIHFVLRKAKTIREIEEKLNSILTIVSATKEDTRFNINLGTKTFNHLIRQRLYVNELEPYWVAAKGALKIGQDLIIVGKAIASLDVVNETDEIIKLRNEYNEIKRRIIDVFKGISVAVDKNKPKELVDYINTDPEVAEVRITQYSNGKIVPGYTVTKSGECQWFVHKNGDGREATLEDGSIEISKADLVLILKRSLEAPINTNSATFTRDLENYRKVVAREVATLEKNYRKTLVQHGANDVEGVNKHKEVLLGTIKDSQMAAEIANALFAMYFDYYVSFTQINLK